MNERRRYPRFACQGGVAITQPEDHRRLWGHLNDISRGGIYVESADPWATGSPVELEVEVRGISFDAAGKITTTHPGVGMGVEFVEVHPGHRAEFEAILHEFETGEGSGEIIEPETAPAGCPMDPLLVVTEGCR